MSNDNYVWQQDVESGEWFQIPKHEYEEMQEMRRRVMEMVVPRPKGQILVISTILDEAKENEYKELWNKLSPKQ